MKHRLLTIPSDHASPCSWHPSTPSRPDACGRSARTGAARCRGCARLVLTLDARRAGSYHGTER
jgi:hypothetical protein